MADFRVLHIDHVELYVPDIHEAAAWYERTLGLTVLQRHEQWAEGGRGPLMISSDDGRTMLALFRGEPQRAKPPVGLRRVAFRVDAAGFRRFTERVASLPVHDETGAPITELDPVDHDGAFSLYFCDPWGNRLELTTYEVDSA